MTLFGIVIKVFENFDETFAQSLFCVAVVPELGELLRKEKVAVKEKDRNI